MRVRASHSKELTERAEFIERLGVDVPQQPVPVGLGHLFVSDEDSARSSMLELTRRVGVVNNRLGIRNRHRRRRAVRFGERGKHRVNTSVHYRGRTVHERGRHSLELLVCRV